MWLKGPELCFCFLFIASYFTNKLADTRGKFISSDSLETRKGGNQEKCSMPIPFFLLLQNTSELIVTIFLKIARKEKLSWLKFLGMFMFPLSAVILAYNDSPFDPGGYIWAMIHILCVGVYKVFQKLTKSYSLTELEEQFLNYLYSVLILILLAQLSGDVYGALEFPFLNAYRFHSSCCASAILGVSLKLASVNVKSNLSSEQYGTLRLVTKPHTLCSRRSFNCLCREEWSRNKGMKMVPYILFQSQFLKRKGVHVTIFIGEAIFPFPTFHQ
ncbi:transmembrane protein 241-like isoform X9 [Chiloscyllium plagiosum]|uniref:transmembrane protein 241-like isoform X9 n=1 Tax=Chiloscyllium plagiosum TaxID=36176 RepID=UPI001CB85105|nr:transmembrane protein 241-like isoform X9 [Chiloscyllium plagiosum]